MDSRARPRNVLKLVTLVAAVAILLAVPAPIPSTLGTWDFRPYWSSTYLLARGEDFGDAFAMDRVERQRTGWQGPYTMHAWFAPTGNLILLPLTLLAFPHAAYVWLLVNITLVSTSSLLLWRQVGSQRWIPMAAAFGFSMTLLSIAYGQVNTLVLAGLALFLTLLGSRRRFAAGAALALTTVKPHLVILTLPLLVADSVRRKEWRVLGGLAAALAGSALLLFVLNPAWVSRFSRLVSFGLSLDRGTPTLSGLLVIAGARWGKWIWTPALVIALALWRRYGRHWDLRAMMDVSIIAGFVISPVGWSYDQVILLIPLLHILQWAVDGSLRRGDAWVVVSALVAANAITFYERALRPSDEWFFWFPLLVGGIYAFGWFRRRPTPKPSPSPAGSAGHGLKTLNADPGVRPSLPSLGVNTSRDFRKAESSRHTN